MAIFWNRGWVSSKGTHANNFTAGQDLLEFTWVKESGVLTDIVVEALTEEEAIGFVITPKGSLSGNKVDVLLGEWRKSGGGTPGLGTVTSITGINSVLATPNPITGAGTVQLVNDQLAPGNDEYYGTNAIGTKGFFPLPAAGSAALTINSVEGDGTLGNEIQLVNDELSPGNDEYYGTDAAGVKGFFPLPAASGSALTINSIQGDGTLANEIELVNDLLAPGINTVYGVDGLGVKGWKADPAGGAGVVSVTDNGLGVVAVDNTDPINPVVGFTGVFVDGVSVFGNGLAVAPITVNFPIPVSQTWYVDPVFGNDVTAQFHSFSYKFATFEAAMAASVPGDVIHFFPGGHNINAPILIGPKASTFVFEPGCGLINTTGDIIFEMSPGATLTVTGYPSFLCDNFVFKNMLPANGICFLDVEFGDVGPLFTSQQYFYDLTSMIGNIKLKKGIGGMFLDGWCNINAGIDSLSVVNGEVLTCGDISNNNGIANALTFGKSQITISSIDGGYSKINCAYAAASGISAFTTGLTGGVNSRTLKVKANLYLLNAYGFNMGNGYCEWDGSSLSTRDDLTNYPVINNTLNNQTDNYFWHSKGTCSTEEDMPNIVVENASHCRFEGNYEKIGLFFQNIHLKEYSSGKSYINISGSYLNIAGMLSVNVGILENLDIIFELAQGYSVNNIDCILSTNEIVKFKVMHSLITNTGHDSDKAKNLMSFNNHFVDSGFRVKIEGVL